MWSFGCILAELYTGYPLFPGENELEQLNCIMELFGLPPKSLLDLSKRKKIFFDSEGEPRIVINRRRKKRYPNTKTLEDTLKCNDKNFINFVEGCLKWEASERLTPESAFCHSWIIDGKANNNFNNAMINNQISKKKKILPELILKK
jgi:dual specificity tyrosine-phosphorylation-regulated kinase 2/3/4